MLGKLFGKGANPVVGVDIGSASIKLCELSGAKLDQVGLQSYVIEPLLRDAVVDGNLANIDVVTETLKRARKKLPGRTKNVVLSLPTGMVITKKINLPAGLSESELELQVEADANQVVPFPLDEVNVDYQVLGPSPKSENEVEVLIAAARKEKIEDRVAAVESAGFKVVAVDVDHLANQAASLWMIGQLPAAGKNMNVAVFDIGSQATRLYVYRNGEALFMRENPVGGNLLTQDIQRAFNMTFEEAEAAKLGAGLPANYESDVMKPHVDSLSIELVRALQFFFSASTQNQIDHVLLGGGAARVPGLADSMARRTNVSCTTANPFLGMTADRSSNAMALNRDAPALLTASGLALRRFPL